MRRNLEMVAVDLVASIAPWLAPLPTAWLIANRTMRYLHWPLPVAIVTGIFLELLGVAISATALELYDYNLNKRKSDPAAALWIPAALMALYLVVAEALTVVLDVWPAAATVAPAFFPVLSIAAFVLLALRASHQRRLVGIDEERAERKRARAEGKKQDGEPEPEPAPAYSLRCEQCERVFAWPGQYANSKAAQNALNAHGRAHGNGHGG